MNFPIPVNLTVAQNNVPVNITVSDNSESIGLDIETQIVASIADEYEGPYSVTPSESVQALETDGKSMTDDVTVGAIPSDYVGSAVPRKTSADLTASGPTVTAPAGYYASAAQKTIDEAILSSGGTFHIQPNISVNTSGVVSCSYDSTESISPVQQSGYAYGSSVVLVDLQVSKTLQLDTQAAQTVTPTETEQTAVAEQKYTTGEVKVASIPSDYVGSGVTRKAAETYTPSNTAQIIQAGQYLEGAQTIEAVAPPYYDMSGELAWLGADATLVKEITLPDVKLANTSFASWTPSTTATDILATRTAGTFTASNMPDYDYYVCWDTIIPIEYNSGAVDKARGIYLAAYHVQALIRRASSYANYQAGNLNNNINVSAFTGGNFYRYYGATQGTITYTNSTSYGFYGTVTANTISSTTANSPTITLKTPKVTARCSTTYLSTSNAALIDQDATVIKQKCRVYRVKKASFMQGVWLEVMRLVQEIDPA